MRGPIVYDMLNISYYFILKISNYSIYRGGHIKIHCKKRPMGIIAHMGNTGHHKINFMKSFPEYRDNE